MAEERSLAAMLARAGATLTSDDELETFLAGAIAAARAAWPTVDLPTEAFLEHLAAQLADGTSSELARLRTSDLWLAAACARGMTSAIQAFEAAFFGSLPAVLRRVSSAADAEEIVQGLRESLFVAKDGKRAKILEYSGRGDLKGWLRVVASRAALNAATRGPKERPVSDEAALLDVAGEVDSAELAYFRAHYEAEVQAIFPRALATLTVRQRLFLRQRFLDALSTEQMSRMHGVHPATIKRHVAEARAFLGENLRRLLCERLELSPSELESVLRVVQSRLYISMRRLLPPEPSSAEPEEEG